MHGHEVVMITGGCGAIGAVVVNTLKGRYPNTRFINLDALTYCGKKEHVEPSDNYCFYYGNICDANLVSYVMETEKPTLLIHLAAETHVDQSFGNSLQFTTSNVLGTHTLLECARKYGGFRAILHMSTDEVYGSVCDSEVSTEESMFAPSNPYSASKAAAEMICHAYERSFRMPITIMRCNNAVSPFQHEEKLIPRCIHTLLRIKAGEASVKIPIHGAGQARRTFIHAEDIAHAIDAIAAVTHDTVPAKEGPAIFNIGTGDHMELSVMDVVSTVVNEIMGPDADPNDYIEYVPDRAFQDYRYSIDSSALRNLGWTERISFQDAVRDVVKHIRGTHKDQAM